MGYGFAGLALLSVEEFGMLEKNAALRIFWWTLELVSSRLPNTWLYLHKRPKHILL
jgi:hypothetical protein